MRIVTISNVRDKVQELFPNLAPFELNKEALDVLVESFEDTQDIRYLRHLKQQAVLSEALACICRKENANYLNNAKVWSNKK